MDEVRTDMSGEKSKDASVEEGTDASVEEGTDALVEDGTGALAVEEGTDALAVEEGTDAWSEEGTDDTDGDDLLKIDVLSGDTRITHHCTNFSGHFYCKANFLRVQFLAILALLAKFAKISTC